MDRRSRSEKATDRSSTRKGIGATRFSRLRADGSGAPAWRLSLSLAAIALLSAFALDSSASAATLHSLSATFGSACPAVDVPCTDGRLDLAEHSGIAVAEASGDLYVADTGDGLVKRFEANGTFLASFGSGELTAPTYIAVDNSSGGSAGDIYVGEPSGTVSKFTAAGLPVSQITGLGTLTGVAVDPSGTLYVLEESGQVLPFAADGTPGAPFPSPFGGTFPGGLSADSLGNLYDLFQFGSFVIKFTPTGESLAAEIGGRTGVLGLGVDRSGDQLYLLEGSEGGVVSQFAGCDRSCELFETFGAGALSGPAGIAVDSTDAEVYVTESAPSQIAVFGAVTVPDSSVEQATSVTRTTATLNGTIDAAGGPEATCVFQYVTESEFAEHAFQGAAESPCAPAGPFTGSTSEPVSADITGLQPETTYRFRLLASNENGADPSSPLSFTTPAAVVVQTGAASGIDFAKATLNGTIDPQGIEPQACFFEWGETEAPYEHTVSCAETPAEIISGTPPVPVHVDLTGLQTGHTYHFRLGATNSFGTSFGADQSFTAANTPTATTLLSFDRRPQSAEIRGEVDPRSGSTGLAADYHFEYGTDTSYGHSTPSQVVASGNQGTLVTAQISGLQPETTYHYRLVAENAAGPAAFGQDQTFVTSTVAAQSCPNEALRTEDHSLALPDCRAYELVSPPGNGKEGGDVLTDNSRSRAAAEGGAVAFASLRSFPDSTGTGQASEFISEREAIPSPGNNGWITRSISPHQSPSGLASTLQSLEPLYSGDFSADLNEAAFFALSPLTDDPSVAEAQNLYTRTNIRAGGPASYTLDSGCPRCTSPGGEPLPNEFASEGASSKPWFIDASANFGHVVFESDRKLTSDSTANPQTLTYNLYDSIDGAIALVGLIPPAGQTECGPGGPACVPAAGTVAGQGSNVNENYTPNIVSDDGSRVFFTSTSGNPGERSGQLFARLENERTVQINIPDGPSTESQEPAEYLYATPDGRYVFFKTEEGLTASARHEPSLYRWDSVAPVGHRLDLLASGATVGIVQSVFGTSENGEYVYFLTQASSGAIYLWHAGALTRIATVGAETAPISYSGWNLRPKESRVSPNGRYVLFPSKLTSSAGYEVKDVCEARGFSGGSTPCTELFLYDAQTNHLECVSCERSGRPGAFNANVQVRSAQGGAVTTFHLVSALSDDGRYVFFSTKAPLVPSDTNGAVDAYEYDTETEEAHLLSSGTFPDPSYFMDASRTGHDVFIATAEPLLGWDVDNSVDLYDVRVDGGFPEPPTRVAPCNGDATCQPGPSLPPSVASPGSSVFQGPGNLMPPRRCSKSTRRVTKHGATRCVRVKKHRNRHRSRGHRDGKAPRGEGK